MSGTFAVPGKIVGAPVKGVGKGAALVGGAVGGAVGGTVGFLGRGFRRRKSTSATANGDAIDEESAVPEQDVSAPFSNGSDVPGSPPRNQDGASTTIETPGTPHSRSRAFGSAVTGSPSIRRPSMAVDAGTAVLSVVSASGFTDAKKIEVRVALDGPRGLKEVIRTKPVKTRDDAATWEEGIEKRVPCAADSSFRINVREHHLMGSGNDLGEATFFVDDSSAAGSEKEVKVGSGIVVVRTRFEAAATSSAGNELSSVPSRDGPSSRGNPGGLTAAGAGGSVRRSFMGRRDRSVTPSGP